MPVVKDQNYDTHSWFCELSCEMVRKLRFSIIKMGITGYSCYLEY